MGTLKQEYCTVGVLIYVDYIGYNSLLPVHTFIYIHDMCTVSIHLMNPRGYTEQRAIKYFRL